MHKLLFGHKMVYIPYSDIVLTKEAP